MRQPDLLGSQSRVERASHHGVAQHIAACGRLWQGGVLLHQRVHQLRVKRAGVDPDANGFAVLNRSLDHGCEVAVVPRPPPHVAGVDPELRKRLCRLWKLLEQCVSVEVEVAHDGHLDAMYVAKARHDFRHLCRRISVVHRDAHDLRPGVRQLGNLQRRTHGVFRIGVRHRLHHHRSVATNDDVAHMALHACSTGATHGAGVYPAT